MEKNSFTHKYQSLTLEWQDDKTAVSNMIWIGRFMSPMPAHIRLYNVVKFDGLNRTRMQVLKNLARKCGATVK